MMASMIGAFFSKGLDSSGFYGTAGGAPSVLSVPGCLKIPHREDVFLQKFIQCGIFMVFMPRSNDGHPPFLSLQRNGG